MRNFLRVGALVLLLILPFSLFVCGTDTPQTADDSKLHIVTTVFPQYDMARRIAGERATYTMLMGVGTSDAHAWEPTAGQFTKVSSADLFLTIGGESESWTQEVISAVALPAEHVLSMLSVVEGLPAHDHDHTGHNHDHALDEHVWTDPDNAILMARAICDALCAIDAAGADVYRANADAYLAELTALSADYHAALDGAAQKTLVVADKFPFRYLAHNYGLAYLAAFPGCASDTEPSLAAISELITTVTCEESALVLRIAHGSTKIADAVAESTGARIGVLHACHTVTAAELAAGETYISLMRQNLSVLQEALGL